MRKAALHNLGCKVNAYETEAMQQLLEEAGYEIVPFQEKADVYVINTCSVTNIADRKSRQMLHRAKKMNPDAVVVAAGCYVQAAGEELKKDAAIDVITAALADGDKVQLVGFGSFEVKSRAARTGRNPRTKEVVEIPASKVPVFKAGKALKDAVAE